MADAGILNSARNSAASAVSIWASSCSSLARMTRHSSAAARCSIFGRRSSSSSLLNRIRTGLALKNANPLRRWAAASSGLFLNAISFSRQSRQAVNRSYSSGSIFLPRLWSRSMRSRRFSATTRSARTSSWSSLRKSSAGEGFSKP